MKRVIYICLILLTLIVSSCDLLQTREAERPESERSEYVLATTPQQLFQNLQAAFRERIVKNYEVCFVDTSFLKRQYKFIPSAGSVAKYNILADWDIQAEIQYFTNLISKARKGELIILTLENETSSPQGDSAQYTFDYRITIPIDDDNIPKEYQGSSQFKINLDANNQWVITEWQDIQKENYPSWSELKGRFYLQ